MHAKSELKAWIIDSSCSNHMIGDKGKLTKIEKYDGGSIKFVGEEATTIVERDALQLMISIRHMMFIMSKV